MAVNWKVLARMGHIPPQAWDALIPQGPILSAVHGRGEAVALNPQPLPPLEAVVGAQLLQNVLTGAIIVVGGREGAGERLLEDIDDWCGTGWPRKWPWPRPPEGWDEGEVFLGAAVAAAGIAEQYAHDAEMQDALGAAAERLMDRAVGG